ncbi:MAG TPA: LysR family transcriptional regulator [Cyclobacteriaceae bacterium]|nr:LysR family transcriptional regulator [Cyclobacteriaceae bacterium]
MEVKYYKLVSAISKTGSLTRAADHLCLTQSALSHQLKEAEGLLGVKIFDRVNRKLVFTDAGRIFLDSANHILEEIDRVKLEIDSQLRGETGSIRLAAECNTCFHWLPRILKRYHKTFPNVDVRLNTQGKRPADLLLAGKIDVAVVYRKEHEKDIQYTELITDDVVGLVAPSHRLASKLFLVADDFAAETYITHSRKLADSVFYERFLAPHKVVPKKVLHFHLTEAVLEMVRENLGVTVMGKWLIAPYVDPSSITMMKLGPSGLKRRWYIATLKSTQSIAFKARFVNELKAGIRS